MKLNFITHYIALSKQEIQNIKRITPTFLDFPAEILMRILFKSIDRVHPNAAKFVLTDLETPISNFDNVTIKRYPRRKGVISSQISGYLNFMKEWDRKDPLIFIDWDMILQRDLTPIFADPCDIMLTCREIRNDQTPINTGLIIIPVESSLKICDLFQDVLNELRDNPEYSTSEWVGDQLFLSNLLKDIVEKNTSGIFDYQGLKIKILDCNEYNFTPLYGSEKRYYPDKFVVHFKGSRKSLMVDYWNSFFCNTNRDKI